MLSLQIPEIGKLDLVNTAKPEVRPHTLLLRVAASGICGTDPHILQGLYPANLPLIPGHEYAGVVEIVGDGVEGFAVGDHVAVDPNILCGVCDFCRRGKVHLCKNLVALGVNIPGGFAEFCVVPVSQAYKVPKSLPLAHAALAEPVGCCLRGVDLAGITSGDRVVIFGAGPMGAIILQLARMQGASHVNRNSAGAYARCHHRPGACAGEQGLEGGGAGAAAGRLRGHHAGPRGRPIPAEFLL